MSTSSSTEATKGKLAEPKMFNVILLNDDFTDIRFVQAVLTQIFGHTAEFAEKLTMDIQTTGRGVVGTYTRDIAETKVAIVEAAAQSEEHPLKALAEEA